MLVNHTPPYKLQVLSLSAFELGSSSRQVRNLYGVLLVDHLSHDAQAACHPCGLPWFNTYKIMQDTYQSSACHYIITNQRVCIVLPLKHNMTRSMHAKQTMAAWQGLVSASHCSSFIKGCYTHSIYYPEPNDLAD
jgi:hypothetical protein